MWIFVRGLLLISLFCTAVSGYGFLNYLQHGTDWPGICATGQRQSPVDILKADLQVISYESPDYLDIILNYNTQNVTGRLLPLTYQLPSSFGFISVNRTDYKSIQLHFHSPSEHTFSGLHHDLEMHIVHMNSVGKIFVIAVFFDLNEFDVASHFIDDAILAFKAQQEVDLFEVFVALSLEDFIFYEGSLTTPFCAEVAAFGLWTIVQSISEAQLAFFTEFWQGNLTFAGGNGNNRATQPLNGRVLTYYQAEK